MIEELKYEVIIGFICKYRGISKEEILRDRECKYLFFLFLKKYNCRNFEIINSHFPSCSKRSINYGLKKAFEKFLINKEFRDIYFEIEDDIEKTL